MHGVRPGLALLALCCLTVSCADERPRDLCVGCIDAGFFMLEDGGAGDGGVPADAGTTGGDGGTTGGPIAVTITAPAEGAVIASGGVAVTARIVASAGTLDAGKLEAQIGTLSPVRLIPTAAETYQATVAVGTLDSGAYDLVVRAATVEGAMGSATRRVIVNSGPIITVLRPAPREPARDTLVYDFTVRISSALQGVTIAPNSVTAAVAQCSLTPQVAPGGTSTAQQFVGTFDLRTCGSLNEGPQSLVITARDSSGITATRAAIFVIDRSGPSVEVLTPRAGDLVGGIFAVQARITDPSGVNALSVFATISHGGSNFTFRLVPQTMSDVYSADFDLSRLPNSNLIQFPALEIVADDALANHSTVGGIVFSVDTVPPIGDLDPPELVIRRRTATGFECSLAFRPVGDLIRMEDLSLRFEAPLDLDPVQQLFDVRAQVEDEGNLGPGADLIIIAKVSTVTYYALDDTAQPLVVDSDADGTCDAINPNVIPVAGQPPGPSQAVQLAMVAIPIGGVADFRPGGGIPGRCADGAALEPPKPLCEGTSMTIAVGQYFADAPSIWTLPPQRNEDLFCDGFQFDALANNIADGWICTAVSFVDGVGNRSVSRPIRLNVCKAGYGLCPDPGAAPNCTGTLNRQTGAVSNTPCTPRRFTEGEVRDLPE